MFQEHTQLSSICGAAVSATAVFFFKISSTTAATTTTTMGRFSRSSFLSSSSFQQLRRQFSSESQSVKRVRNIWISGLIDPEKVTQRERSLLYEGDIEEMHRVRRRNEMYHKEIEESSRKEYIQSKWNKNIRAGVTFFNWKHHKINIIHTPGRVDDFTVEVETALRAFDGGAIDVLCGVNGVQSHSIAVDKEMIRYQLPRLIFINNLDHKGANPWQVLNQERSKLQHHCAAIQVPIGLEDDLKGLVDLVHLKAYYFHGSNGEKVFVEEVPAHMEASVSEKRQELIETVSEVDDKLAEALSSDRLISGAELEEAVRRVTIARKFIPVFMGGYAFKYKGLQLLLDGVTNYLPCPTEVSNYSLDKSKNGEKDILVALAFTLKERVGQITYLRIYEGVIRKGDFITDLNFGKTFEVPHLIGLRNDEVELQVPRSIEVRKDDMGVPYLIGVRNYDKTGESQEVQEAHAGEIVMVHDVNNASGDTFTDGLVRYTRTSIDVSV
ncbi:putative translation protein, beta-barrel [Medicago truncatula]|uniref:Putative translation protein, beta-barrel n=1 Tax=Medicago truncatula TaxID=3880 RepID=A0A396J921_MEDTR|nr:elongation factor G-2, mitochondrial isoform X1 [Medicago truncatula]RHN72813.1 putative translation protein, beta-barrel [Medicago truncatula]